MYCSVMYVDCMYAGLNLILCYLQNDFMHLVLLCECVSCNIVVLFTL